LLAIYLVLPASAAAAPLDILYQPARSIEVGSGEIICEADSFQYRYDRASGNWNIERRKTPHQFPSPGTGDDEYQDLRRAAEYRFVTEVGDDEIRLSVHREQDGTETVLAELELYDRPEAAEAWYPAVQESFPSEMAFSRRVRLSRPRVSEVWDDGRYLWVPLSYSRAEDHYGLGTLVRVDALTGEVEVFQPPPLATSSLTHAATAAFAVWLGTADETASGPSPTRGLVRFDPVSGRTESHLPGPGSILGRVITALEAEGDTLWIGTDEGICRYRVRQKRWTCWRPVPMVRVLGQVEVSNRPGGEVTRRLHRGDYEVRWATGDSLEVITREAVQGWIRLDARERLPEIDPYAGLHTLVSREGAETSWQLLYDEPGGAAGSAAVVVRVPLEKLPLRTAEGWQKVKSQAGWVPRTGLVVVPEMVPVGEN
jgi:hypothetical protein